MIRKTLTEIPIQMGHQPEAQIHLQHPDLIEQQLIYGILQPPQQTMITGVARKSWTRSGAT